MLKSALWVGAIGFAAFAVCAACSPQQQQQPSRAADPPAAVSSTQAVDAELSALPFSNRSPAYEADRTEAMRRLQESSGSGEGDIVRAVYGVSLLMILHELGHEFARRNGMPAGFGTEEFADFFAVNLLMSWSSPENYADLASMIEATNIFISHAPYSVHGGENGGTSRRNAFSCAFIGYNMHLMDWKLDAVDWWHESNGWNPQFRHKSWDPKIANMGSMLREETSWVEKTSAEYQEQRKMAAMVNILMLFRGTKSSSAGESAKALNTCGDKIGVLRHFIVEKLSTDARFEERLSDSVASGEMDSSGAFNSASGTTAAVQEMSDLRLHYERPETDGAWFLFSALATGDDRLGLGSVPRTLFRDAWLQGDPTSVHVRALYCGIGIANASVVFKPEFTLVDLCYEVGEELESLRAIFRSGDASQAIIDGMLDIAPIDGTPPP